MRLKPDFAKAHYNLGIVLVNAGHPQEAIKHFLQTLRLKPDHMGAYANLVRIYDYTNQPSEAIAAAQKALDLARSKGQSDFAKQIDAWLSSYKAKPFTSPRAPPPANPNPSSLIPNP